MTITDEWLECFDNAITYEGIGSEPIQTTILRAWENFKQERGQEHWRCQCAREEQPTDA
jgi:hypothetical protein